MVTLGAMSMPENFRYRNVFCAGRPRHEKYDSFSLKHPAMDCGHRAKIFAPFDALKGFSEAISAKDVQYVNRIEPSDGDQRELNNQLDILHNLTWTGTMARANGVIVTVKRFVPCSDEWNDAFFKRQGQYESVTGIVLNVDDAAETITLQGDVRKVSIPFEDILNITPQREDLFDEDWN